MRIITLNANGIRSAARKGLFHWLAVQRADVVCLQETKCQIHQLGDHPVEIPGYQSWFYDAQRKGYAGVAVYSRRTPDRVIKGFGTEEFDGEGRFLELQFDRLSVVSLYLPSGSAGPQRQASKFRFLKAFMPHLRSLKRRRRGYILCGDWNIAHKAIDLRNWRSNQKNSGFLPEERAWMDELLGPCAYSDAFREVCEDAEQYTWWSNRGQSWAKNVGWRIDYQILSPSVAGCARTASIYKEQRFSDHAPLVMDYKL